MYVCTVHTSYSLIGSPRGVKEEKEKKKKSKEDKKLLQTWSKSVASVLYCTTLLGGPQHIKKKREERREREKRKEKERKRF